MIKRSVSGEEVILWAEEESGFSVEVPGLPGCYTDGDTLEEALKNAKEAIDCHREGTEKYWDHIKAGHNFYKGRYFGPITNTLGEP